jgi:hypothetical protein
VKRWKINGGKVIKNTLNIKAEKEAIELLINVVFVTVIKPVKTCVVMKRRK